MYAVMHRTLHKSPYAQQTALVFINSDLWVCFCGFIFFFFSVLKDESKKHNAESAHNKGALLNTASGTTLYSMTVTAKPRARTAELVAGLSVYGKPKPTDNTHSLFDMQNFRLHYK